LNPQNQGRTHVSFMLGLTDVSRMSSMPGMQCAVVRPCIH
jgi:hypothetical protein